MKKILGAIFGSAENTKTVVDGAVNGLDKLFFTAEEKSEASAKVAEWYLRYLAATQPQNLARRLLALIVALLWALLILTGVVAWPLNREFSLFVFSVLTDVVAVPFAGIMAFYFATHIVRTWQAGKVSE